MADKKEVENKLKTVMDPHTGIDVVEMGLIRGLELNGNSVTITFVPTTPFCPMVSFLTSKIEEAAMSVKGIKKVTVVVGK